MIFFFFFDSLSLSSLSSVSAARTSFYLSINASTLAPGNANSLHAAGKLPHRGLNHYLRMKVTIFLSGLWCWLKLWKKHHNICFKIDIIFIVYHYGSIDVLPRSWLRCILLPWSWSTIETEIRVKVLFRYNTSCLILGTLPVTPPLQAVKGLLTHYYRCQFLCRCQKSHACQVLAAWMGQAGIAWDSHVAKVTTV